MILLNQSYPLTVITVRGILSLSLSPPPLSLPLPPLSLSLSHTHQIKQSGNLLSYTFGSSEVKQTSALGDWADQQCHQGPFFCSAFLTGLVPLFRLLDGAIPALHPEIAMLRKKRDIRVFFLGRRNLTRSPTAFGPHCKNGVTNPFWNQSLTGDGAP